jgi:hypothetical protein
VPPVSAPYRPGQQWPDNRPQRPERPPPIQFRQEEPPPAPNRALQWTLRIAGLVAVAVVSGLAWYYVTNDDNTTTQPTGQETTTPRTTGKYDFTPHEEMPSPNTDRDCAKHAYNRVKRFLQDTPCDHLSRQLFVMRTDDGRTVYTSVSVVIMPTEDEARDLRDLTDKDGSGNISDVVRDGLVKIPGLEHLSGGNGYKAKQTKREVIIVESAFAPKDKGDSKKADEKILDDVSDDALRLAAEIDGVSGSG